jgi:hypothetical protein
MPRAHKGQGLNTGNIGAMGELLVTYDLMSKGWEVFRSVSPSSTCDLIALKDRRLLRVEVTKGVRKPCGLRWVKHDPTRYDLLAVWETDGTITYDGICR